MIKDIKDYIVLIYGPAKVGKSTLVNKLAGNEIILNDMIDNLEPFPTIYVSNFRPNNIDKYDIIIKFNSSQDVLIEKMPLSTTN